MVVRFALQGRLAPTWFCTLFEINELQNEILGKLLFQSWHFSKRAAVSFFLHRTIKEPHNVCVCNKQYRSVPRRAYKTNKKKSSPFRSNLTTESHSPFRDNIPEERYQQLHKPM
jgi:hypothetical protein